MLPAKRYLAEDDQAMNAKEEKSIDKIGIIQSEQCKVQSDVLYSEDLLDFPLFNFFRKVRQL